jgi:SNF2 family DNA or RNA helicase
MGLDTIVEYDWRLALGDEVLEFSEFQRLVELKKPLVKVRGEWIELKTDEIEKAIAFFQKRAEKKKMTLADIMALTLEDESSSLGLPVVGVDNFSNNEALFSLLNQSESLKELPVPVAFKGELRPYQRKGLSWLWFLHRLGLGGCLADDMGLGKTIQMIALFLHERSLLVPGERLPPTLIMCPMSIISNWKNELKRFAPEINVLLHHGINRMGKEEFAKEISLYDVVITTYALVAPDLEKLNSVCWNRIVLDEAQNIKNNHTKQTQAIKKLNGGHRVALTGTPLENRLLELWSIMDFLNPYYLGGAKEFSQKYAVPIERFGDVDKSEQLKRVIRPFILRRVKTDKNVIKDLPEKIETKEHCYLTKEQVSLYESVVKRMLETIDKYEGIKRRGIILSVLIQLKQICNHPVQYLKDESSLTGRSGKMTRLHELLDEVMAEGDKALIFTQFSQMGHLLKKDLQERLKQEVLFLHGMSTKTQRDEMIERFQSKDSAPHLFILSLKAGGLGLNLTSANHVFHFDRWWNPAIENQATDRAFRIGQKKTVHVHKFMCQGTVEEKIDEMIKRKTHLTDLVVEQGENWITELSTEDLKNLFHLKLEDI